MMSYRRDGWRRALGAAAIVGVVLGAVTPAHAQSTSTTTIRSSLNPSLVGQSVTFTATVAGNGNGAPTNSVTFKDGGVALGGAVTLGTSGGSHAAGQAIATGAGFTCALTAAGGVKCWGTNTNGELGDNSTTERHTPVDVSGLTAGVAAIAAGGFHACALTVAGGVKCWGLNANGQLGDNSTTERHTPVDVVGLSSGVVAIAAGLFHTCALTGAGGVKCWGPNVFGRLGDNSVTERHTPVDVVGLGSGVTAIAAGASHTCALTAAGGIKCWGYNDRGQLGDGSTTERHAPVAVTGLGGGVTAIAAGGAHTCALTGAGGVKCWGWNNRGEVGDSSGAERHTPVDVSGLGSGVAAISAMNFNTCALTAAGGVKCWGYNANGQLGDNNAPTDGEVPVDVSGLGSGVASIAVGHSHACALTGAGALQCWGDNGSGQVGDNTITERHTPVPVSGFGAGAALVYGEATFTTTSLAPGDHSITAEYSGDGTHIASTSPVLTQSVVIPATATAIRSSSNPGAAGQSVSFTALVAGHGNGAPTGNVTFKDSGAAVGGAVTVETIGAGRPISAGKTHACTLTAAGSVRCWGRNEFGQLGDNSTDDRSGPVDVLGLSSGVVAVTAGYSHTCVLTVAGGVKCWGGNGGGQLGDNSTTERHTPVDVLGLGSGVAAITAGDFHTCALTVAGGVKCWGFNNDGQLGDNSTTERHIPVDVLGLGSGVTAIAAGGDHTCALAAAGGVKCWGFNNDGQLGDNSTTERHAPVDVSGLGSGVTAIAAGGDHTCALATAGGVKCWGTNDSGELGDDSTDERHTPVDVSGLGSGVAAIAAGNYDTCALTTSGDAKCWGYNGEGQLGDGTNIDRHTPANVSALGSGVAAITVGELHTCALTAAGGVECWGSNSAGQVGDNTHTDRNTPTGVAGFGSEAALLFGTAKLTVSTLAVGDHTLTAEYSGDGTHSASTSPALVQSVAMPPTATTLTSSDAASAFGQRVILTAHTTSNGGTPAGTVTFKDGAAALATRALSGGSATLVLSSLAVGTHRLKAVYAGNASFAASASAGLTQKVAKGKSTTVLATSPRIATSRKPVTLIATVRAKAPARGRPTGRITFKDGRRTLGRRNLARGRAVLKLKLKAGKHRVVASYSGSGQFMASRSPLKPLTVRNRPAPSIRPAATFEIAAASAAAASPTAARGAQDRPALARLGDGFVAVWRGRDEARSAIYGQRFDVASAPVGERFVVTTGVAGVSGPAVAALNRGGFVVAWASRTGIEAQRFDGNGRKRGARLHLAGLGAMTTPALAATDDGGFVAGWTVDGGIAGRRYDGAGRRIGARFSVEDANQPALAALDGGFALAWVKAGGIHARVYGEGKPHAIEVTTGEGAGDPILTALDDGRFIVAWTQRDGDGSGIFAQRFTAGGDKAGGALQLNATIAHDQAQPALVALDGGGFAAAWTSVGQDGSGDGVVGRSFNARGEGAGEFIVNAATQGDQSQPVLLVSGDRLVAAWTSAAQDSPPTVEGQSFILTTRSAAIDAH